MKVNLKQFCTSVGENHNCLARDIMDGSDCSIHVKGHDVVICGDEDLNATVCDVVRAVLDHDHDGSLAKDLFVVLTDRFREIDRPDEDDEPYENEEEEDRIDTEIDLNTMLNWYSFDNGWCDRDPDAPVFTFTFVDNGENDVICQPYELDPGENILAPRFATYEIMEAAIQDVVVPFLNANPDYHPTR